MEPLPVAGKDGFLFTFDGGKLAAHTGDPGQTVVEEGLALLDLHLLDLLDGLEEGFGQDGLEGIAIDRGFAGLEKIRDAQQVIQAWRIALRQPAVQFLELFPVAPGEAQVELRSFRLGRFQVDLHGDFEAPAPHRLRNHLAAVVFEFHIVLGQPQHHIQVATVQGPDFNRYRKFRCFPLTATECGHAKDQDRPPRSCMLVWIENSVLELTAETQRTQRKAIALNLRGQTR